MNKIFKLNFYFLLLVIGTLLIPTISGLPKTPTTAFYVPFWMLLLSISNPRIFVSKGFFLGYFFFILHFIYLFFFYTEDRDNERFMLYEVVPILFSFSLLEYFLNLRRYKDLSRITNLIFFGTILTTVTSAISLNIFPSAARDLAGQIRETPELAKFYSLVGIGGFYFYIFLAILAPVYLFVIFKNPVKKVKLWFCAIYFISFYTVLISQYAASISLFILSSLATVIYLRVKSVPTYFLFFLTSILLYTNKQYISNSIINFSYQIDLESLSPRLRNIALIIDNNNNNKFSNDLEFKGVYDELKMKSLNSFNENIFTGGGKIGDHVFWYDVLGTHGLIGLIPWLFLFYYILKSRVSLFKDEYRNIYYIVFFALMFIGFHKPFRLLAILPFITFIIPAILIKIQNWMNSNESFLKS
jgi:hypothetical protein